ncbi:MAG: helix-turn-helix transcriptional regulator [Lentisphaerae bacterium]|nr:helix-turn-helix transcriptional regulator [Lentisphaerota bacterium]
MRIRNFEIFEQQAKLCAMMASAKRLAIVEILKRGEASVGDIAAALGCTISTASQHLRLMRDKQVVVARKDAQTVFYRLRNPKVVQCCHMVRELLLESFAAGSRLAKGFDPDRLIED